MKRPVLVEILVCGILIFVGLCYLLCMFSIYMFTPSSCVWVRNGVEILTGLRFAITISLLLCCSSVLVSSCFIMVSLGYITIL
jgi:hypothetical protein